MLIHEVAESLFGVRASRWTATFFHVLEELLVGLRVSFSFQRPSATPSKCSSRYTVTHAA
ncbi:hypothetical protein PHMEG_0006361 [Phytophthora megakarya]|uniref:Uncharacterized protein n=1 Tax=Phytophthora megakarya TaxID=4795 RepID=A0A225WP04_9STRA|nr:hypothetical protein PHMEG_0006361 [Phytophthora megakarya]